MRTRGQTSIDENKAAIPVQQSKSFFADHRPESVQIQTLQYKMGQSPQVQRMLDLQQKMAASDTYSTRILSPAGVNSANDSVVQGVLYKGVTDRGKTYKKAVALGDYTREDVRKYIDAPEKYGWNKTTKEIRLIEDKPKKKRKRSESSTGAPEELKGWMKTVDEGVEEHNKKGKLPVKYKARTLKDEDQGGFSVGINNIADIEGMEETDMAEMNDNQEKLNFLANHVMTEILQVDTEGKTAKEVKDERKAKKRKLGPEIQQIVGKDEKGGLRAYFGGNLQESQKMLRGELLDAPGKKKGRPTLREYHTHKYRPNTIKLAVARMEAFIREQSLGAELQSLVTANRSKEQIKSFLKKRIGDKYKTTRLSYLYQLRNALRATYGTQTLEDAEIYVPDNEKQIHAESNLLDIVILQLESILDVVGTKVPCVACFAKFCSENQQAHLLQYTSSIWFSEPCMNQLGCDYSKQSMGEVLSFLSEIDLQLKGVVSNIKRYTGHQGNIKQTFNDDDSGSEGEEARDQVVDKYF